MGTSGSYWGASSSHASSCSSSSGSGRSEEVFFYEERDLTLSISGKHKFKTIKIHESEVQQGYIRFIVKEIDAHPPYQNVHCPTDWHHKKITRSLFIMDKTEEFTSWSFSFSSLEAPLRMQCPLREEAHIPPPLSSSSPQS